MGIRWRGVLGVGIVGGWVEGGEEEVSFFVGVHWESGSRVGLWDCCAVGRRWWMVDDGG